MEKYQITEEELNKILLYSAQTLPDRPGEHGMKASEVKARFYGFIRFLVSAINRTLDNITSDSISDLVAHNNSDASHPIILNLLKDLQDADITLGNRLSAHNNEGSAHKDIRKQITDEITEHSAALNAHIDIRRLIASVKSNSDAALAIASGLQRVRPVDDYGVFWNAISVATTAPGDMFLLLESNACDFIVLETEITDSQKAKFYPDDIKIDTFGQIESKEIVFEPNKIYYIKGKRVRATKGNLETGLLAKEEDLEALREELLENRDLVEATLLEINEGLLTKETALNRVESTEETLLVSSHTEHNLGLRTSVGLEIDPSSDFDEAIVNFRVGETVAAFDAPASLYFTGDDCLDGRLYPNKNRIYEINIKSVMGIYVARVGACDYEVIE